MDLVVKHLEMIQRVIDRQASNSFQTKSWTIALLGGLVALGRADKQEILIAGVGIIILFWVMDSYFLSKERGFRSLYDNVRKRKKTDFTFNFKPYCSPGDGWIPCIFRPIELVPYGAMLIGIIYFTVWR